VKLKATKKEKKTGKKKKEEEENEEATSNLHTHTQKKGGEFSRCHTIRRGTKKRRKK